MTKIEMARAILKPMSEIEVYFLTFPTRGPGRYKQEWTHEDGAKQLASSRTKAQLKKWIDS
jgi:hypothetical protein